MIDLLAKPPDQVTAKDIEALVAMQTQEDAQIEFKENLSTRNGSPDAWMQGNNKIGDYARNTILREAVAFANAYGGTLLLGIKESKANPPVAAQITPLPKCGELAERLRKQFRDCVEPQIPQLEAFGVKINEEKGVVVVRVGRSRMAPHRVSPTRSCPIRRADRTEEMTMREIQDLTLNVARGMERLDGRFAARAKRFREEFGRLTSPDNAFGLRFTALPVGEEVAFEKVIDKGRILAELQAPWLQVSQVSDKQRYRLDCPIDNLQLHWRPILRGVRADVDEYGLASTYTCYKELHCDGLIELGFAASSEGLLLHPDWPLVLFANAVTWANHVRSQSPSPLAEYGLEVEFQVQGNTARVGRQDNPRYRAHMAFAEQASRQDGNERELDRQFPKVSNVKFPRYPIGTGEDAEELLSIFRHDFWNWLRIDCQEEGGSLVLGD